MATYDVLTRLERQCLAKIAAIEVIRECIGVASISTVEIIRRLEHVEHDATSHLDFGLALRYSVELAKKFDIRVTHAK